MTSYAGENDALAAGDPRELGPYRLLSRLGRGGMGTVLLGEDPAGRRVAVKVINTELAGEAAFRERFRREVTAARQVRRFCTAPVVDAELERDPLYVVTEFIDGPSLERAVAERGPLPGSELEGVAVGVATALAAIHAAGIVHRDLKPANVLLSATGPRVIDFGIARALDAPAGDGPTRTGQFVGTPNYLPPELLRGEPVTPASDVFSWGCVVAYAGTGRAPFDGGSIPEIFYKVAHEAPALDGLDPDLRDVVSAALDKDPRRRPSVEDLLSRLVGNPRPNPAQLAETVQASWHGPGPAADPTVPARDRNVPPTAQLGGAPTQHDRSMPPAAPPVPPRPSGGGSARPLAIGGAVVAAALVAGVALWAVLSSGGPPGHTAPVFNDDFSQDTTGWYGNDYAPPGPDQGYENGHYRVDLRSSDDINVTDSPVDTKKRTLPTRALVTANVRVTAGPDYGQFGLYCRGDDSSSHETGYQFLVRKDGKGTVIRKVARDGGSKELYRSGDAPGYRPGEENTVQIACEQNDEGTEVRLRLWLNGKQTGSVTDKSAILPNANAGLALARVSQSSETMTALFDDFEIAEID
ncbi:serine/threonine-protein kinase [Actinomadura atramentaria]|uniref:serine/threonine-protein kinase n=1 Tax=Actinomadura atramentaria TaxID=1990 RepID=UPI00039AF0AC|nr:serine/threonine-protein kinase [Actinomadura atramentaria]